MDWRVANYLTKVTKLSFEMQKNTDDAILSLAKSEYLADLEFQKKANSKDTLLMNLDDHID